MMMPMNVERYWFFREWPVNYVQANAVMVYDEVKDEDNVDPCELVVDRSLAVVAVNNVHVDYENYINRRPVVVD